MVEKINALESVARAWSKKGISYGIANGLENYPDGIGRDVDVVVERGKLVEAVQVVVDDLSAEGWVVIPNRQGWIWWIVAFKAAGGVKFHSLQIDLFEYLQWAFTRVVDGVGVDAPLRERGPFLEDPGAVVAKTVVLNGLSKGASKFRKKPEYLALSREESEALPKILERISGDTAPQLTRAVADGNFSLIDSGFQSVRGACFRKAIFSKHVLTNVKGAFLKQWVVNWRPQRGAPIIEVKSGSPDKVCRGIELLQEFVGHLVYQDSKLVDFEVEQVGLRSLKRLSCLQVVLIFVNQPAGHPLRGDLVVDFDGNYQDMNARDLGDRFSRQLGEWLAKESERKIKQHRLTENGDGE